MAGRAHPCAGRCDQRIDRTHAIEGHAQFPAEHELESAEGGRNAGLPRNQTAVAGQQEHPLPIFSRLQLTLEGQPLNLTTVQAEQQNNPDLAPEHTKDRQMPQLLILSSGELSPFTLRIEERAANGSVFILASNGIDLPLAERVPR